MPFLQLGQVICTSTSIITVFIWNLPEYLAGTGGQRGAGLLKNTTPPTRRKPRHGGPVPDAPPHEIRASGTDQRPAGSRHPAHEPRAVMARPDAARRGPTAIHIRSGRL